MQLKKLEEDEEEERKRREEEAKAEEMIVVQDSFVVEGVAPDPFDEDNEASRQQLEDWKRDYDDIDQWLEINEPKLQEETHDDDLNRLKEQQREIKVRTQCIIVDSTENIISILSRTSERKDYLC